MRKYTAIIFTALGLMLTACGNNSTTNGNSDRTLENETEIEVGTKVESTSDNESTSSDDTSKDESDTYGTEDTSDTEYLHVHGPYVMVTYHACLTKIDTWLYGVKRDDRADTDKVYFLFNMDIM